MSEQVKCVKCGHIMFDKAYVEKAFPPDKYNYCHSYCCVCCPDAKVTPCDKEKIEGTPFTAGVFLVDKTTGKMTRWLPR